ncbi:MAG: GNAT family N-acetyltransferase [Chloroflexi bacterium]|nr:GNAT family N-acetyltransferase [Chloroflexota bacterium]
MTDIQLPKGYTLRSATMDDIPACVELFNAWAIKEMGHRELSGEEIRTEWSSDEFIPEEDTRIVFAPDGTLVAYIEAWTRNAPPVKPWIWARIHPDHYGLGLGTELTQWAERYALRVLDILPPDVRIANEVGVDSRAKEAHELFKNLGFSHIRSFYQMRVEMDSPPPAPRWVDDLKLKPFDAKRDLEAVYRAEVDSFKDHFGVVEEPFETGFPRFAHYMTKTENYDPALWFVLWDGDEIAGLNICRPRSFEDDNMGWVSILGVRRAWRKRGLGLALLQHSFGEFYKRGVRKVGLGVDASSLTGALRLYEKAGMSVFSQFDKYEKEIRAGKEISVQSIEE